MYKRQLLRLREELKRRKITPETFKAEQYDVTKLLKKVHYAPLKYASESGMKISCVVLKGFKELLHWRTQTDTYFSKEISDRVRVIAVSYTHLRAHETVLDLVCRLLLEKKNYKKATELNIEPQS